MNKTLELPNVAKGNCYFTEYVNGVTVRNDWQGKTATITLDQWTEVCSLLNQNQINAKIFELMDRRAAFFAKARKK
jgi:hypothetical protein